MIERVRSIERFYWGMGIITAVLGLPIIVFLLFAVRSLHRGSIESASAYGSLIVGLATLLLVFLTGVYTYFTKKMVRENQEARERKRQRKLESLRRGLKYEIEELPEDKINSMGFRDTKRIQKVAPRTIFEQNASSIGLLSDEEVDAVVAYYQQLSLFEDYIIAYSRREGGGNLQSEAEPLLKAKEEAVPLLNKHLD